MGFYSPEVVLGDAKRHGIDLLPVDINVSAWEYTIGRAAPKEGPSHTWEPRAPKRAALRTGLRAVKGIGEQAWQRISQARENGPYRGLEDFCKRVRLPCEVVANLIRAGALDAFGSRRALLWQLGGLDYRPAEFDLDLAISDIALPPLDPLEQTVWEYELLGWSPSGQIMQHYRAALRRAGVLSVWQVKHGGVAGRKVRVVGQVVVRQRPATAKGILFLSLEDESGLLDLVVKPDRYPSVRPVLRDALLVVAEGVVQRNAGAVSVLVTSIRALTP